MAKAKAKDRARRAAMTRREALASLAGLAGCAMAGCGPGEATGGTRTTEVVLWHAYRAQEQVALDRVIGELNAAGRGVKIRALQIPSEAFADKLTAAIPRGNGPDIFIFAHDRIGDWAEAGILEPVSSWASTEFLRAYLKPTVEALVYKKSLYGLPMAFKSVVLFYNKALIQAPPRDDAELVALAKAHTDAAEKKYGLVYQNTSLYFTAPFIHGFGGGVLGGGDVLQLDTPGTAEGLRFARALLAEHKVIPADVDANLVTTLFNSGKAAMAINGPWFRGEIKDGVDWGVAVLPTIRSTGLGAAPFVGSEAILLSKHSPRKDAAFEAMTWLTGERSSLVRMEVAGQPAAHKAAWSALPADDPMQVFKAQLEASVIMPGGPVMRAVWSPTDQAIFKVVKDGADPAPLLKTTEARIRKAVK